MNTGGHYPSSGRGIWTPDLQLMRLASYRTATIPRYWLLGTHLRDASLFATITPPAVPYRLGFEPRPFLWPIKIWRRRIAVCISILHIGIEPISSALWAGALSIKLMKSGGFPPHFIKCGFFGSSHHRSDSVIVRILYLTIQLPYRSMFYPRQS